MKKNTSGSAQNAGRHSKFDNGNNAGRLTVHTAQVSRGDKGSRRTLYFNRKINTTMEVLLNQ